MEEERTVGTKSLQEIQGIGKGLKDKDELPGVKSKASAQAVEGGFRDAEMFTEGKDGMEAPGKPSIKKRDYKSQGKGGMRDEYGEDESVGLTAGRALKRGDGNPVTGYIPLVIGDKIPEIRAVEGEGG